MITRRDAARLPVWAAILVLGTASIVMPAPVAAGNESVELQVKAAYLLHFVRYVYWPNPPAAAASTPAPVTFGVLGRDPIYEALEATVSGKTVNSRPIRVKMFASIEQIDHCDILYVPRSESKKLQAVLTAMSSRPVLTVSDKEGFSGSGGMIEFLLVDDTVRFAINNESAEKAGLKLSSELLRVAYSVSGRRK